MKDIWTLIPDAEKQREFRARTKLIDAISEAISGLSDDEVVSRLRITRNAVTDLRNKEPSSFDATQLAVWAWKLALVIDDTSAANIVPAAQSAERNNHIEFTGTLTITDIHEMRRKLFGHAWSPQTYWEAYRKGGIVPAGLRVATFPAASWQAKAAMSCHNETVVLYGYGVVETASEVWVDGVGTVTALYRPSSGSGAR